MIERSTEQRLLDVMPLAKSLQSEDIAALQAQFPEFDVKTLLDKSGEMGTEPDGSSGTQQAAVQDAGRKLRALKFELQLALKALDRVLPQCDATWKAVGKKLRGAAQNEFYASVLSVLGGGGAAGAGAASQAVPAVLAGVLACAASLFTLYSQWQRKSLKDDLNLATVYANLAEQRGILHQLKESLGLYATAPDELLTDREAVIFEAVTRALKVSLEVDSNVSSVAPLVGSSGS